MARLSDTRFKVDRVALVAKLEQALKTGDSKYNRALAAHEAGKARAQAAASAELSRLSKLDPAKLEVDCGYGRSRATLTIKTNVTVPEEPRDVACDLRRTIDVLKLSSEATVMLSADQYGRYFPCET